MNEGHCKVHIRKGPHSLIHKRKKDPIQGEQSPYGEKPMMNPIQDAFELYGRREYHKNMGK